MLTQTIYDKTKNIGHVRLMDDDGVGLFTLEWLWSTKQNKAIPWHHYTYKRSPELYCKACAIVSSLCLSQV